METERLDVRLDRERRRKLRELAADQNAPVSDVVRGLIDQAYEEKLKQRRKQAALKLAQMELEDVPDPAILSQQLEDTYEPGGLH